MEPRIIRLRENKLATWKPDEKFCRENRDAKSLALVQQQIAKFTFEICQNGTTVCWLARNVSCKREECEKTGASLLGVRRCYFGPCLMPAKGALHTTSFLSSNGLEKKGSGRNSLFPSSSSSRISFKNNKKLHGGEPMFENVWYDRDQRPNSSDCLFISKISSYSSDVINTYISPPNPYLTD